MHLTNTFRPALSSHSPALQCIGHLAKHQEAAPMSNAHELLCNCCKHTKLWRSLLVLSNRRCVPHVLPCAAIGSTALSCLEQRSALLIPGATCALRQGRMFLGVRLQATLSLPPLGAQFPGVSAQIWSLVKTLATMHFAAGLNTGADTSRCCLT